MNIKNWVGADLSERSFRQIYSGHLERIGQFDGHATDSVEREVTLFDNQMVICYLVSQISIIRSGTLDYNISSILYSRGDSMILTSHVPPLASGQGIRDIDRV